MPSLTQRARWATFSCACALTILCFAWEGWIAPLRPGGSTMVLKALPVALLLSGLWHGRRRTFQWATLIIWFYFAEGTVRTFSERGPVFFLAIAEIILSLLLVTTAVIYVRTVNRSAE